MLLVIQNNARVQVLVYTDLQLVHDEEELYKDIHDDKLAEEKEVDFVECCQLLKKWLRCGRDLGIPLGCFTLGI